MVVCRCAALFGGQDEQIGEGLMVAGQHIRSYVRQIFHLEVVTFVHGAFEAETDESVGEFLIFAAILSENFHAQFYFGVDFLDG